MKMNKEKKEKTQNIYVQIVKDFVKENAIILSLMLLAFVSVSVLNFVKISTTQTVASFDLDGFEIDQIADRTIIANKTLPADENNATSVQEGEKIIKKGFPITEESMKKLKKMSESPLYIDYRAFANNELYLLLLILGWFLLVLFLTPERKNLFRENLIQVLFFVFVYFVVAFGMKLDILSSPFAIPIIIPSSLFIMLITILYGKTQSIILSIVMSLGVLNACDWALEPFIYTFATSLCSVVIVHKIEKRIDLVFASIVLALYNIVILVLIIVIFNETFTNMGRSLVGVAVNGFISGILTLGFLTPLEMILNTASVFRLMDLSDLNNPLMQKMRVNANGTNQHSLMVAQLAENACREIGANALLARVGAYYHDIGKIEQPLYFVENQQGENKHDEINPTLSATVLKSHVKKGVEKAKQLHLPSSVIDIIAEHHGNSVMAYFYNEAKEKDPTLTPEDFSYPGNPPSTKESAVVMLADTVEAACRTLENPSVPRLEKFITTLINGKVEHNQLDNCNLTFRDVSKIKEAFVQVLAGYYHSRIRYPDQKNVSEGENQKDEQKETQKDEQKEVQLDTVKENQKEEKKEIKEKVESKEKKEITEEKKSTKDNK
ncbi:MAG: HDIG domain-containing protein [Spirochaetaceae bacterium]|nr:HDIG domain-containing protein [Spirochaetaceae bacterium]